MPSGKVKWFSPARNYGFIIPDGGGKDIFVHRSDVEAAGLRVENLFEGVEVTYKTEPGAEGKLKAVSLRLKGPPKTFAPRKPKKARKKPSKLNGSEGLTATT